MRHVMNYCKHCGDDYVYLASGDDGKDHTYDNYEYCQECYKAISDALSKIPLKVVKEFVPSTDFTKEQFLQFRKDFIESKSNTFRGRRTWPGLFRLDGSGDTNQIEGLRLKCPEDHQEYLYRLSWWTKSSEWTLEKEVRVRLIPRSILET